MSGTQKRPRILQGLGTIDRAEAGQLVERSRAANERVDPTRRLAWLVALVQRDPKELEQLLAGSYSDLRMELASFAFKSGPREVEPTNQVLEAIGRLRDCLRNLRRDLNWDLKLTFPDQAAISRYFSVAPKTRRVRWSGAIESFFTSDHFPTAFLLFAADVIEAEGLRVHECVRPECRRLFVKRKRGAYCSIQCSQRERDQRFRKRHPSEEIRQRRHRLYLREVEEKHGSARARHVQPRPAKDGAPHARKKTRAD